MLICADTDANTLPIAKGTNVLTQYLTGIERSNFGMFQTFNIGNE